MLRQMPARFFQAVVTVVAMALVLLATGCANGFGTDLPQQDFTPPKPQITSLTPSSLVAGSPGFTLTVSGVNFTNLSQVNWNGGPRNTTFVSASQLKAEISSLDIAQVGTEQVTVVNAASLSNNVAVSDPAPFVVASSGGPPIGIQAVISVNTAGDRSNAVPNTLVALSANGRYAAFQNENATNLVGPPTVSQGVDIYFRDSCVGAVDCGPITKLASVINGLSDDGGNDGNSVSILHGAFAGLSISGDGRFVVFLSHATNLVSPQAHAEQAYIRDTCIGAGSGCTPSTKMVSITDSGTEPNLPTEAAEISASGRFVAFVTAGNNVVAGVTLSGEAYLRDTNPGCAPALCTILVSADNNGNPANNGVGSSIAVSANGRFVIFQSDSTNLPGAPSVNTNEAYVRDTCINASPDCRPSTVMVSVDSSNAPAALFPGLADISDNGRVIAFNSPDQLAPNSVLNEGNMFLRDTCRTEAGPVPNCMPSLLTASVAFDGSAGNNGSSTSFNPHILSGTGRFVVFESEATNLVAGGTPVGGVFARDTCLGAPSGCTPTTVLVSQDSQGTFLTGTSAVISSDGHFCAFMVAGPSSVFDVEQSVLARTSF